MDSIISFDLLNKELHLKKINEIIKVLSDADIHQILKINKFDIKLYVIGHWY